MRRTHHRWTRAAVVAALATIATACGTPEPSRIAPSDAGSASPRAAVSVEPTSPAPPSPTLTPTPTASPTPAPPTQPTIASKARVASGDSIQVDGTIHVDGAPLAGATLKISAIPIDGRVQTVQLKGTVPADAKFAHVGIRVNTEGISEPGPANITIYRASYTQGGGRNRVPNPRMRSNTNYWGLHEDGIRIRRSDIGPGLMVRVVDKPSQRTVINTGGFDVTPGATYRATMLLKVTESTVGHAYFTVTWLSDATEIRRERLDLRPAPHRVPDRRSTRAGRFKARFGDLAPGRYRIIVEYPGDDGHLATRSAQIVRVR